MVRQEVCGDRHKVTGPRPALPQDGRSPPAGCAVQALGARPGLGGHEADLHTQAAHMSNRAAYTLRLSQYVGLATFFPWLGLPSTGLLSNSVASWDQSRRSSPSLGCS